MSIFLFKILFMEIIFWFKVPKPVAEGEEESEEKVIN